MEITKLNFARMAKHLSILLAMLLVSACAVQNNVTFATQTGNCADGSFNAPYCMAITIQNNNGGQNLITNTSFAISDLTLSITGPSNVGYPTSSGSSFDPSNCLGSSIAPGASCTFYLWLNGESAAVGTKPPVVVNASYTINNSLFGGSTTTANSSVTVYETPSVLITNSSGLVEEYNANGYSLPYHGESGEVVVNSVANDNYYGYLYLAGNNGIYLSGNGNYVVTATETSSSIRGASNLLINGQSIYGVPVGSLAGSVYNAGLQNESFAWTQYATGLSSTAYNIATLSGTKLFFTQSASPSVFICNQSSVSGNNCNNEGVQIPNATNITALAFSNLGSSNGVPLTGLIAGASNGLWVESGVLGLSINQWLQVQVGSSAITNSIVKITSDNNLNSYIVDASNKFYLLAVNGSNLATQISSWVLPVGQAVAGMVYDNAGQQLFVTTASGLLYACVNQGACNPLGSSGLSSVGSLSLVTALTAN